MNERIAKKWAAALKSGEYNQTSGKLKTQNHETGEFAHCCLGVLCEIYGQEHGFECFNKIGVTNPFFQTQIPSSMAEYPVYQSTAMLPRVVKEWAGMRDREGAMEGNGSLMSMNDSGSSFSQIAEVIENNIEKL